MRLGVPFYFLSGKSEDPVGISSSYLGYTMNENLGVKSRVELHAIYNGRNLWHIR